MSSNPEIAQHDWRVLAYDDHDYLVLDTIIRGKTLEEVADWCTTHPNYEEWARYSYEKI